MWMGGQRHAPAALTPVKTRYSSYRRLGGPQDRSGRMRKISSPPGFDPRTVHLVASRYTDWAIPAHKKRRTTAVMSPGSECGKCNLEPFKIQVGNADIQFTAGDVDRVREFVASG